MAFVRQEVGTDQVICLSQLRLAVMASGCTACKQALRSQCKFANKTLCFVLVLLAPCACCSASIIIMLCPELDMQQAESLHK